jgi:hypothetical protein
VLSYLASSSAVVFMHEQYACVVRFLSFFGYYGEAGPVATIAMMPVLASGSTESAANAGHARLVAERAAHSLDCRGVLPRWF